MGNTYVYVVTGTYYKQDKSKDGFMIHGIYTDFDLAKDDLDKHIKYLSSNQDVKYIARKDGLQSTQRALPQYTVTWVDGNITRYSIQERILDKKIYK